MPIFYFLPKTSDCISMKSYHVNSLLLVRLLRTLFYPEALRRELGIILH